MRKTTLVVVFLLLIGAAVTGLAQVDTGTVVGTIKDASGAGRGSFANPLSTHLKR